MKYLIATALLSILCLSCIDETKGKSDIKVSKKQASDSKVYEKPLIEDDKEQSLKKIDTSFILDKNRSIEEYKENINKFYKLVSNNFTIKPVYVESIIPRLIEEYRTYYSFTYTTDQEKINLFYSADQFIVKMAQEDKGNCLRLYFNMAEFVDGEYAEGFFSDAYFIAEDNTEKFCSIYNGLSELSRESLVDIYKEFCEGTN